MPENHLAVALAVAAMEAAAGIVESQEQKAELRLSATISWCTPHPFRYLTSRPKHHQKMLPIRHQIVLPPQRALDVSRNRQCCRSCCFECWLCTDYGGVHPIVTVEEKFLLIRRPERMFTPALRHLNGFARSHRRPDVNLQSSRLRRCIRDPAAIRRVVAAVLRRTRYLEEHRRTLVREGIGPHVV